jgi:hypothetical protein
MSFLEIVIHFHAIKNLSFRVIVPGGKSPAWTGKDGKKVGGSREKLEGNPTESEAV